VTGGRIVNRLVVDYRRLWRLACGAGLRKIKCAEVSEVRLRCQKDPRFMTHQYTIDDPLHPENLKKKQRELRVAFPLPLTLRVHRALSWLRRAEGSHDDSDVRFILLWIGFNAAYAGDLDRGIEGNERDRYQQFFNDLIAMDVGQRIYAVVWNRFSQEIRALLNNCYVFSPFWRHQNGEFGFAGWEITFEASKRAANDALTKQDTPVVLSILFDRLYVLRNQLLHGGATWNSAANRDQVRDGAALLGCLLPVFVDLMMDNPAAEWVMPNYPVVE